MEVEMEVEIYAFSGMVTQLIWPNLQLYDHVSISREVEEVLRNLRFNPAFI